MSKIGELRPEVAKEVLVQFPEFVGLMKSAKEKDSAFESRKKFYDVVKQVQADCSKLLDNPNLSSEMIMEILNREAELVKLANEKDTEIRQKEKEVEDKVNKKDSGKREFNWKQVGAISVALMTVAGISAGVFGGEFDFSYNRGCGTDVPSHY